VVRHIYKTRRAFTMEVMTAATFILIAPCSLLLGAVLQILVARLCSARAKGILAFLSCVPALLAVIAMVPSVRAGQAVELNLFQWDSPLALVLHVDALSVLFAFMGSSIGAMVLLYSIGYMAHDKSATRFFFTMLVFIGGFIGLVYSANLFIFYLCWELVGLCSFSLVGFWYTNPEAVAGARKVLLMTHIAGYGLLAGILVLVHRTGSASVDRSECRAQLYHRDLPAHAGCPRRQERPGCPSIHGFLKPWPRPLRSARCSTLLVTSPPASISPRACTALACGRCLGSHTYMDRHHHHGRRRHVRHGAD